MKKILHLLFTLPLLIFPVAVKAEDLKITVENIPDKEGRLYISLADSKETFVSNIEAFYELSLRVKGTSHTVTLADLEPGEYAVSIFYDMDDNGAPTFGKIMPLEPFGFSNNVKIRFGPPSFKKAKIDLSEDKAINIVLSDSKMK